MKRLLLSLFTLNFYSSVEAATIAGCRVLGRLERHESATFLASSEHRVSVKRSLFRQQVYVWALAGSQNFKGLEALPFDITELLDTPSPASGLSPLGLAALCHDLSAMKKLVALGAQVDRGAGYIETPWGILENPKPMELAVLGTNFADPRKNSSAVKFLASHGTMLRSAITRIEQELSGISVKK